MKYLKIFTDFLQDMEPLSDDERGRLFSAMLRYAEDQTETDLTGNERFLWGTAKKQIDGQIEAYINQCEVNRRNRNESLRTATIRDESSRIVTKEDESSQEKEKDKEENIRKIYVFTPPTVDEVRAFVDDYRLAVDAERFVDFYASKGWMVGKNKMKDWRAAVRSWSRRDAPKKSQYRNEDLERLEVDLTKKRDYTRLPDSWRGIK